MSDNSLVERVAKALAAADMADGFDEPYTPYEHLARAAIEALSSPPLRIDALHVVRDVLYRHMPSHLHADMLRGVADEIIAALKTTEGVDEQVWPETLTPELADILGRPCFMFIKLARVFRAAGFDIEKSAEAEQAFFLHRFMGHWFKHGETGWRDAAEADLQEMNRLASEALSNLSPNMGGGEVGSPDASGRRSPGAAT